MIISIGSQYSTMIARIVLYKVMAVTMNMLSNTTERILV